MSPRFGRRAGVMAMVGVAAAMPLWLATAWTAAEPPAPASEPKAQEPAVRGDPEMRQRLREALRKRLENARKETDRMEQLAKALDEGKSFDEIRQMMPESGRWMRSSGSGAGGGAGGGGRSFGEMLLRRIEDHRGGDGFSEVDTLGPTSLPGMGPRPGGGGGAGAEGVDRPSGMPDRALTDEEREAVRDVLTAAAPGTLKKIDELRALDPAQADRKYAEAWPRMKFLMEMRSRDRAMYDLTLGDVRAGREAMEAARALVAMEKRGVQAGSDEYKKGEAVLRGALGTQFEQRTRILQHQMEKMRERQATMARDIATRSEREADVVNRNAATLVERERRRQERGSERSKEPARTGGT
ncbi:MAG: hypothetical protein K2W85_00570 [Phycisphaerales bacterium]|nr:hypothetical protein [Phycisphaerales bacterium]